jgi:hypothetical protein
MIKSENNESKSLRVYFSSFIKGRGPLIQIGANFVYPQCKVSA